MTVQPTRDQLRALANAAAPGPWEFPSEILGLPNSSIFAVDTNRSQVAHVALSGGADAVFIAAARTAVPQLLDQLEKAEADRDWNLRSSRIAKKERIEANARAERAEARIQAVRDVCDDYSLTDIWGDKERIATADIRRALDGER